jgi:hypothetical protein
MSEVECEMVVMSGGCRSVCVYRPVGQWVCGCLGIILRPLSRASSARPEASFSSDPVALPPLYS